MSKHTPGPWCAAVERMGASSSWAVVGICSCWETENAEANACLIAAAPELLEALISVCLSNDEVAHPQWKGSPDERMARAAIAKATGEPQ